MRWGEDQLKPAGLAVEEALGLTRAVGGVIVEQDADQQACRISGIELPKEVDELARAVSLGDGMVDKPGNEVDGCRKRDRAKPFVFVVALDGRVLVNRAAFAGGGLI
jgi:hypothetical protein